LCNKKEDHYKSFLPEWAGFDFFGMKILQIQLETGDFQFLFLKWMSPIYSYLLAALCLSRNILYGLLTL